MTDEQPTQAPVEEYWLDKIVKHPAYGIFTNLATIAFVVALLLNAYVYVDEKPRLIEINDACHRCDPNLICKLGMGGFGVSVGDVNISTLNKSLNFSSSARSNPTW